MQRSKCRCEEKSETLHKMVGFGKKFQESRYMGWKQYAINYKLLKKKIKRYLGERQANGEEQLRKEFMRVLDLQIEKFAMFLLEQEGKLATRFATLNEERELARNSGDPLLIEHCVKAYRALGMEILYLLQFVELNATGLRKILKKFDKTVTHKITDYYVSTRANHPFSQLQKLFRHAGIEAMLGSLTRSIAELNNGEKPFYDDPASFHLEDPVVDSIKGALERLTYSTRFLSFLSKHALIGDQDELPSAEDEAIEKQYDFMALVLNLMNTFLYMVNTYIVVPSADKYAISLGAAPTLCGVIIGSMAVAQLISSVYFSSWSNRSYFKPLFFSSVVLLLGNMLYAVAYDFHSLSILIAGRLLCGLGSARAVNRRYITDWVPINKRLQASAAFVTASALGMAAGPALAGLFKIKQKFFLLTIDANTLPGLTMVVIWLLYIIWLWLGFKEPVRKTLVEECIQTYSMPNEIAQKSSCGDLHSNDSASKRVMSPHGPEEQSLLQPLTETAIDIDSDLDDTDNVAEESEYPEEADKPANSFCEALQLLTNPVKVQLGIYFMLKYAMEIILSESSVVTTHYFGWTTGAIAMFVALLGFTVLPVNFLIGVYISNLFEDRQILVASEVMTCVGLATLFAGPIPYTKAQYMTGALIGFVSTEVLEGVNLSLLSKVMSPRLAKGTYNNGLLSTEAGTLARVVADGTITLAGYCGINLLLNLTLTPALAFALISLIATFFCYNSLY